jgi:hypothetical protein
MKSPSTLFDPFNFFNRSQSNDNIDQPIVFLLLRYSFKISYHYWFKSYNQLPETVVLAPRTSRELAVNTHFSKGARLSYCKGSYNQPIVFLCIADSQSFKNPRGSC